MVIRFCRWRKRKTKDDEFIGVALNVLWLLKQDNDAVYYKVLAEIPYDRAGGLVRMKTEEPKPKAKPASGKLVYPREYYELLLWEYFQLDVDLAEAYAGWEKAHEHFRKITNGNFRGIRVLNQDPVENLFSFICSQNNHISRISSLVEKLAKLYGTHIADFEGFSYYNFPAIESLAREGVESNLRTNGFGYRAKFINRSAQEIIDEKGGVEWFKELRESDYQTVKERLMTLTGIGPKVADCICLMSLKKLDAIPVDTHIYKIARTEYRIPDCSSKTVTRAVYEKIGNYFRDVYGPLAGWAQTILFCADLRKFQEIPK